MSGIETEAARLRRLGVALSAVGLLLAGFFMWMKLTRGVAYIGPVPTPAFWLLPTLAGCWLAIWPQRRKAAPHVRILAVATAVVLIALASLLVLHGAT